MDRFVTPDVYYIGQTTIDREGLNRYLLNSGNEDFITAMDKAREEGLSDAEILCSFYAKLCYRALSTGHNANITRTRDIWDNLVATFDSAHGSVFEHVQFNFIIDNCSRVLTHELVRHRIGVAFSQTSGRYCRYDFIPIVFDPVLEPVRDLWEMHLEQLEKLLYETECHLGLRVPPTLSDKYKVTNEQANVNADCLFFRHYVDPEQQKEFWWVPNDAMPFAEKKKLTSACRRLIPQGISNEMGFSCNLRSLRHIIMMRTARGAEWEIRHAFGQIYKIMKAKYPLVFHGAREEIVDGLVEVTGLRMQPYEKTE